MDPGVLQLLLQHSCLVGWMSEGLADLRCLRALSRTCAQMLSESDRPEGTWRNGQSGSDELNLAKAVLLKKGREAFWRLLERDSRVDLNGRTIFSRFAPVAEMSSFRRLLLKAYPEEMRKRWHFLQDSLGDPDLAVRRKAMGLILQTYPWYQVWSRPACLQQLLGEHLVARLPRKSQTSHYVDSEDPKFAQRLSWAVEELQAYNLDYSFLIWLLTATSLREVSLCFQSLESSLYAQRAALEHHEHRTASNVVGFKTLLLWYFITTWPWPLFIPWPLGRCLSWVRRLNNYLIMPMWIIVMQSAAWCSWHSPSSLHHHLATTLLVAAVVDGTSALTAVMLRGAQAFRHPHWVDILWMVRKPKALPLALGQFRRLLSSLLGQLLWLEAGAEVVHVPGLLVLWSAAESFRVPRAADQ